VFLVNISSYQGTFGLCDTVVDAFTIPSRYNTQRSTLKLETVRSKNRIGEDLHVKQANLELGTICGQCSASGQ
jgi:hypothetical protein